MIAGCGTRIWATLLEAIAGWSGRCGSPAGQGRSVRSLEFIAERLGLEGSEVARPPVGSASAGERVIVAVAIPDAERWPPWRATLLEDNARRRRILIGAAKLAVPARHGKRRLSAILRALSHVMLAR